MRVYKYTYEYKNQFDFTKGDFMKKIFQKLGEEKKLYYSIH